MPVSKQERLSNEMYAPPTDIYRCKCGRRKQLVEGALICILCETDKLPDKQQNGD